MSERETYRSWRSEPTEAELAAELEAERRRERRRRWVRPTAIWIALAVGVVDTLVLAVSAGVLSVARGKSGRPCSSFFRDFARDATTGIWVLLILVVVTVLLALVTRQPWVVVTVLVVQVLVVAILVPRQLHTRDQYLAVAEHKASPLTVDTGGIACDPKF